MADRYLLESGSPDGYLLEDASGVVLLEAGGVVHQAEAAVSLALTNAAAVVVTLAGAGVLSVALTVAAGLDLILGVGGAAEVAVTVAGLAGLSVGLGAAAGLVLTVAAAAGLVFSVAPDSPAVFFSSSATVEIVKEIAASVSGLFDVGVAATVEGFYLYGRMRGM